MPTHVLGVPRLVLGLMLCLAAPALAKPPGLPLPVHPELTPEERPLPEGAAPEAVKPAEPEIFFVPLLEPVAPLAAAKDSEEEQEPKAKTGCPFGVQMLSAFFSGPFGSRLWGGAEEQEPRQAVAVQVFGSYDVSDLMGETAGNNVEVRPSEKKLARQLMRYIEGRIRPGSWESQGGKGGIEYSPETNSLSVRHYDEVQQEVAGLLEGLRQLPALGKSVRAWLLGNTVAKQEKRAGGEEASSVRESAKPAAPILVAMGHDLSDLMEGRDAGEVVRELTRTIETTVAPESWHNRGGPGRLDYNPELKSFFIVQTPEVQEAIRELLHLKRYENMQARRRRLGLDWPGEPERRPAVIGLLETAHQELLAGRHEQARQLVRQALAADRKAVFGHPLVYKMQLLHQVLAEPEAIKPRLPGVDPSIIRAYHEILEQAPKRTHEVAKPAVLEVQEEACELEIVTGKPAGGPALCIDRAGQRLRVQLQLFGWTFKLTEDAGKAAFTIDWTK